MNKNRNWKRHMASAAAAVVAAGMISACGLPKDIGKPSADSGSGTTVQSGQEGKEQQETVSSIRASIPEDSILYFGKDPGLTRLLADMEAGEIPVECDILYDEKGTRPEVAVKDPGMIRELFDRLSQVTVGDKSSQSATEACHYISFRLRNDTNVACFFMGEQLFFRGEDNYQISGGNSLFSYIRQLQDEAVALEQAKASQQASESSSGSEKSNETASKETKKSSGEKTSKTSSQKDDAEKKTSDKKTSDEKATDSTETQDRDGQTLAVIQYPAVPIQPQSAEKQEQKTEPAQKAASSEKAETGNKTEARTEESSAAASTKPAAADTEKAADTAKTAAEAAATAKSADPAAAATKEETAAAATEKAADTAKTAAEAAATAKSADPAADATREEAAAAATEKAADTAKTAAAAEAADTAKTAATAKAASEAASTAATAAPAGENNRAAAGQAYIAIEGAYRKYLSLDRAEFLEKYENGTLGKEDGAAGSPEIEKLLNYDVLRDYFAEPEGYSIYSGTRDYNGDGTQELIIAIGNAEFKQIRALYTFDGSKAVSLFQGDHALGERTALYTLPDKSFLLHASGGASAGGETICRIADGGTGLEILADYMYDQQTNGTMDHISKEETLTEEQFREKYWSQAKNAEEGVNYQDLRAGDPAMAE